MSVTVLSFAAVAAGLVAVIGVSLAWHARREAAHLRTLLLHNEQSRRALAEQLVALREQLEAGAAPMGDLDQRRAELDRLLAAGSSADASWQDTMPSVLMEFAPTQPAEPAR